MARPKSPHPTPGELEVLHVLWSDGPSTVREVMDALPKQRAYTSVMSLLNVMTDKVLVTRAPEGRAFRYTAKFRPDQTQKTMLRDLLDRVFEGSATALVARLLEQSRPTPPELDAIHQVIDEYQKQKERGK
ncbi:MAG TPA: BlaI/MecI/CopY family transcriptional regulator [Gemmataceae bacterium]|nr:BlaI/MecI/CopY family transcriptional regulator [Gemmataceae bacterium]